MAKYIYICILLVFCFSCKNKGQWAKEPASIEASTEYAEAVKTEKEKELRYLFFANGGLIGYFDDGTVAACPRCDLFDVNVKTLYEKEPIGTYIVNQDGSLFINNKYYEYPRNAGENEFQEWAMIDYQWIIEPEKIQ